MIIVGTYPDAFIINNLSESKLTILNRTLKKILPSGICLHILPFYPNSGDFGFAPDDWFQIRKDLGQWEDISILSANWNVIVDGIYNHVGVNHEWVKKFNTNPKYYEKILHAYNNCEINAGPFSPRGQPVLVKTDSDFYFWKTFSEAAVDLRLNSDIVQNKISEHLSLLSSIGVWGIRLDAVAYYSKFLGSNIRHNPGVYKIANLMVDKIKDHKLQPLAQLDCDEDGLCYFSEKSRRVIPINDFTYSTYLAISILEENPNILVRHVENTKKNGRILVRVPRTHDGILLRSKLLEKNDKEKIIEFANTKKISVRIANNDPYELNCSAPYLYSLINENIEVSKTILFSIAVTGMFSGWSYFYLPYLLGYTPELLSNIEKSSPDPRALNRLPIDQRVLDSYLDSDSCSKIYSLLSTLSKIHSCQGYQFKTDCFVNDKLLILTTLDRKYSLIANFSKSKKIKIPNEFYKGEVLEKNGLNNSTLNCFGFVITSLN